MLTLSQQSLSQTFNQKIIFADSLYNLKKYGPSLKIYENIYNQTGKYSLAMLLKMAFINEISGEYSKTLFYLNIFYHDQPNKKVLSQMEFLDEKHNLKGYKYTDLEYFISLYNEYYYYIIVYILAASITFFAYLLLKKLKKKRLGLRPIVFIGLLIVVYYITNYRVIPPRAIIAHNNTILMSAPSAASELVNMAGEGHRVTIHNKKDIWYEISLENTKAFIKEDDLYLIPQKQKSLF